MANAQQVEFLNSGLGTDYGLGWVYTYESGTTTNKTVYTSADKLANATNPFQLDANGRSTVYAEGNYTLVIKDVNLANAITLNNLYYSVYSADNPNVVSKSADYTTSSTDYLILVNTAAGNITITPVMAVGNSGVEHLVIKTSADANTVIIDPAGSQTIGGSSTKTITAQYQAIGFMSDNSNWQLTTNPGTATLTGTETFTNKTLTSPVLTGPIMTVPQIQDTSSDHQYVFAVNELAADRTVTLPLLLASDEFVFKNHIVALTNKDLSSSTNTIYVPPGVMQMYAGATAPTGYLLCDGTSYLRADYAALFAVLSTTYGSADGTHFNVPDLRGRIPIGVGTGIGGAAAGTGLPTGGSALTAVARAGWKGAETHVLSTAELAAHAHGISDPGHAHALILDHSVNNDGNYIWRSDNPDGAAGATDAAATGISISSAGSGTAHNNIQPVMGVNFIIKT